MKREILFRGFCPDENGTREIWTDGTCNGEKVKCRIKGEWIEGYFFKIWHEYYILWGTTNDIPNMLEVLPETVGMWTGLTDKNGKKIFEGDIVDFEYDFAGLSRGFIIWNEDDARFEIDDDGCFAYFYETRQMEIIGTIFDKEGV